MKVNLLYILFVASLISLQLPISIASTPAPSINTEQQTQLDAFEKKMKGFSEKKQNRVKKRLIKLKDKIESKLAKREEKKAPLFKTEDTSGVALGLIIVLAGALVAVLGLAGVADILITIGLVVLIIGLIVWLID